MGTSVSAAGGKLVNFRKLKQDFSPNILKEGKQLFESDAIVAAKLVELDTQSMRFTAKVLGNYDNTYECEMEIDRVESEMIDSNCDCPYQYDCQHLSAMLLHLEKHIDELMVVYSKESTIEEDQDLDEEEKAELRAVLTEAKTKEAERLGKEFEAEILQESVQAAGVLGRSPFFLPEEKLLEDKAELGILLSGPDDKSPAPSFQLALRLPYRSKPLNVPNVREFFEALRYREPISIGGRRYFFSTQSFDKEGAIITKMFLDHVRIFHLPADRSTRVARLETETFGMLLARAYELAMASATAYGPISEGEATDMPCLYWESFEQPLQFSPAPAVLTFNLEYLEIPQPKLFLQPALALDDEDVALDDVLVFECARPGVIHNNMYYRFNPRLKRKHLRSLEGIKDVTVPEPLFGTFVENALPELMRYSSLKGMDAIERFVTLPFTGELKAECELSYLDGELDAALTFLYGDLRVPASASLLDYTQVAQFVTDEGILARNLTEEESLIQNLFQDFAYNEETGVYVAKTEKKIVEFMTEVVPRNQARVEFQCPENLLDRFIYDNTSFELHFSEGENVDCYSVELKVDGHLKGISLELLWECISSRKAYVELEKPEKRGRGRKKAGSKPQKILVLDLDKLTPVVQLFDEIGLSDLDNYVEQRPLWSLASLSESSFEGLPVECHMTDGLKEIQKQILGQITMKPSPIPKLIKADLRGYQKEGVAWLERLRKMYLSGVLADDMGLGKTLQAIVAITQYKKEHPDELSLVVCPTSLTYNWKEEISKFNPKLKPLVVDGTPAQRRKLLAKMDKYDVLITSYSLIQKDIDLYSQVNFGYAILDEAQHIKNRTTRNAKSTKEIQAKHRLILTGTPIENSLEELWSLFDFLMPGLLSSYERFVEKYIRTPSAGDSRDLTPLRRKVSPFIMRRMKEDVVKDLPPVSEILYHCELSGVQKELYRSYAKSAREELSRLVKKEGFDKVQIHVLATLTRLKQICCHPAIFAKDKIEPGDSSKYDMLFELLQTLIEGNHKTVIFSQYTRMLQIMREDLKRMGIQFSYLDGSSKNRLDIVNNFNEDPSIPVFLVSLKAGGTGLNLTGADSVVHYDMWWNPAVENQATDRVHRIGQQRNVSSYKLVTKGTIEEKILEMQQRKKGLVKKVVSCDDEAMAKLTWDEVLELLQT